MTQSKRKAKVSAKRKTEKTIQIIAGVVVLVVLAVILGSIITSQKPAAASRHNRRSRFGSGGEENLL